MNTPLWQALQTVVSRQAASFHTPGHKNGRLVPQALRDAWGSDVWRYDMTEIPGLDNLAHPEGALADSMAGWAAARGCAHVQYLLGGTSLGIKAALLALCRGRKVFVPRHAHGSVYQGLVLAGAEAVPLPVRFDDVLGIPLGVAPEDLSAAIAAHPDCRHLLIVHPTYHGITWQNEALFAVAHEAGLTTIVDAAHGAHFTSAVTPSSALALGADVVIESAHKTLPCLTQASVMLIRDADLVTPLTQAVALLHTTSPSYLLMASLEQAGAWLANEGEAVMQAGMAQIQKLEAALDGCQHLRLERRADWQQDPFKCYLTSPNASGETIARLLDDHGCVAEMSDGRGCLLMLPLDGGDPALAEVLTAVDAELAAYHEAIPAPCYCAAPPQQELALADAWLAPRHRLPLNEAVGHVAAAILEAYPPGIPLLLPGERISEAILHAWVASGRDAAAPVDVLDNA